MQRFIRSGRPLDFGALEPVRQPTFNAPAAKANARRLDRTAGSAGSGPVNTAACIVVFTLVMGWGMPTRAGMIFVSQQRSVSAGALGSSQSFTAPDFAPFDRTAFASSTTGQGSWGGATQYSVLDPVFISLSGSASAHGTSGGGSSVLDVVFDLAEPVSVELTGVGSASSSLMPDLRSAVSLARGTTTLVQWQAVMGTPDMLDFSDELEPGRYTLHAAFSASNAPGFTATNAYSVNLIIPEPAGMAGMAGTGAVIGVLLRRLRRR